jgi:putative phosphoesterase
LKGKKSVTFFTRGTLSQDTAAMFAGIDGAKFIAVYGNCDTDKAELSEIITGFGGEIHETYEGEIAGRHIFMAHRPNFLQSALESGKYDLIIYGHTHRLDIRKAGRTLVVNPGTIRFWHIGRPYVVIVELDNMTAEPIALA